MIIANFDHPVTKSSIYLVKLQNTQVLFIINFYNFLLKGCSNLKIVRGEWEEILPLPPILNTPLPKIRTLLSFLFKPPPLPCNEPYINSKTWL